MERIELDRVPEERGGSVSWWERYYAGSGMQSLPETARWVIGTDSEYVLRLGVLGAGEAGAGGWPASRQRSGLVMGAVQSGKTASMLGVTAKALDAGIDLIVILAGTRLALWKQTYERVLEQLLPGPKDLFFPTPELMSDEVGSVSPSNLYQLTTAKMRLALKQGRPAILVVMKNGHHLKAASNVLHDRVYPLVRELDRTFHLLVLDDEADDGSVLDAVVERALDPLQDAFKQTPRHIIDLWTKRDGCPETATDNLYATYVGYTATPQANFLQADQNPLSPRDFVAALRTPSDSGVLEPRSTTYREPSGVAGYYAGGDTFYHRFVDDDRLVVSEEDLALADGEDDSAARARWIAEAVRAYLVAGAIRLWRDPANRMPSAAIGKTFTNKSDLQAACPPAHTMLFHPSFNVNDHFAGAAEILQWGRGLSAEDARNAIESGCRELSTEVLFRELDADEELWRVWLDRYRLTGAAVANAFSLEHIPRIPAADDWSEIKRLLVGEVIPYVRLSIVNSDPDADDRPEFSPQGAGSEWRTPRDLLTIFISGNVMARGLTLEGLTTTLFLRSSGSPMADTQMQMQRWFGYRGHFLELCRVFLPVEQVQLFRQFNEADEALRRQIVEAMNATKGAAPSPLVLEGERFRATGKIAGTTRVPLCPGATPFVDIVNDGFSPDPNVEVVRDAFLSSSTELTVGGRTRGRILEVPLSLGAAAALLDRLRYGEYVPDLENPSVTRWGALEAQLGLARDVRQPLVPLFRPPPNAGDSATRDVPPNHCPYSIAAYLRLWSACLDRRARGFFPTDDGECPWSSLDLADRRAKQPSFYVGIRYGSGQATSSFVRGDDSVIDLGFEVRAMSREIRDGALASTWGSRNPSEGPGAYLGDQLFDYHFHGAGQIPNVLGGGPVWRPVGAPGLILFHIVHVEDRPYPVVAVGVCIPLGGPDHFAARPRT